MDEVTTLTGTPIEVQELVRAFYSGVMNGIEGYTMTRRGGKFVRTRKTKPMLDAAERSLWEVTIRPLDGLAPQRCRDSMSENCARLELVNELYDILEASR